MLTIFKKEINAFLSSLTGYIAVGVFLVFLGILLWILPQTSILTYGTATLDSLFANAPLVFLFLIPAITMRSFSEEKQTGTIELLATRPLKDWSIIWGKYLAALFLVVFAILPTLLYWYTVYQLGSPKGNIDAGATLGSYFGLLFLGAGMTAIGIFVSSTTSNQIVAFLLSALLGVLFMFGFEALAQLPIFFGKSDDLISSIGMQYHYNSLSRGVIELRDVIYFSALIGIFLVLAQLSLSRRKW